MNTLPFNTIFVFSVPVSQLAVRARFEDIIQAEVLQFMWHKENVLQKGIRLIEDEMNSYSITSISEFFGNWSIPDVMQYTRI